jgi:hypothetical protein
LRVVSAEQLTVIAGDDFFYNATEVVLMRVNSAITAEGEWAEGRPTLYDVADQVDQVIEHLRRLPRLERVRVEYVPFHHAPPKVHPATVPLAKLKAALPNCEVVVEETMTLRRLAPTRY